MRACALHTCHRDPRRYEFAADYAIHQPVAFFHYSGHGVVTYLEGSETHFGKQHPAWMNSGDQDDSESDTQDGGDDETDDSGEDGDSIAVTMTMTVAKRTKNAHISSTDVSKA